MESKIASMFAELKDKLIEQQQRLEALRGYL
jgi:hypothetical protein